MIHVIADTNLFIQCRALQELKWHELFSDDEIHVLLVPKVVRELDELKRDGKGRRTRRARKATELLRALINSDGPYIIQGKGPRLTIGYTPVTGEPSDKRGLDSNYNDHRIFLQALEYREKNPNVPVVFLTHETHQQLTAKEFRFPCLQIPDTWLLEDESDERDREIQRLAQEVVELRSTAPKISIAISNTETGAESTQVRIIRYPALSEKSVEHYTSILIAQHPMVTSFEKPQRTQGPGIAGYEDVLGSIATLYGGKQWRAPSEYKVNAYQKVQYPAWGSKLKDFFCQLHKRLEFRQRLVCLNFKLDNNGFRPALNALVQLSAKGNLQMRVPKNEAHDLALLLKLPPPPPAPKGRYISLMDELLGNVDHFGNLESRTGNLDRLLRVPDYAQFVRAPDEFFWDTSEKEKPQSSLERSCSTWRHQVDPDEFCVEVVLPRQENEPTEWDAVIACKVSAENIAKPLHGMHKVSVTVVEGDIEAAVNGIVEEGYSIGELADTGGHSP